MKNSTRTVQGDFSQIRFDRNAGGPEPRKNYQHWYISDDAKEWGAWCKTCHRFLKITPVTAGYKSAMHFGCEVHYRSEIDEDVAIRASAVPLIHESRAMFDHTWWHSSTYSEDEIDASLIQHVGSKNAALHRAMTKWRPHLPNYIYKVELNRNAAVEPVIWVEGHNQEIMYALEEYPSRADITRYINGKEAPGDMSLFVNSKTVRHVKLIGTIQMHVGEDGRPAVQLLDESLA